MLRVREARASTPPAAAAAAAPSPHPILKSSAAAVLLKLLRLSTTAALCLFLGLFCACTLGIAIHVVGRWICGEGSAVEEAGWAILVRAMGLLVPLLPPFFLLIMSRLYGHLMFFVEEVRDKKQYPPTSAASLVVIVELATVYMLLFVALVILAMWMKLYAEEGSPEWRLGSVLFVRAAFCASFVVGFLGALINMVLLELPPKAKGMV